MGAVKSKVIAKAEARYVRDYHAYQTMKDRYDRYDTNDRGRAIVLVNGLNELSDTLGLVDIWVADDTRIELIKGGP